jgi:hypothetical protein
MPRSGRTESGGICELRRARVVTILVRVQVKQCEVMSCEVIEVVFCFVLLILTPVLLIWTPLVWTDAGM